MGRWGNSPAFLFRWHRRRWCCARIVGQARRRFGLIEHFSSIIERFGFGGANRINAIRRWFGPASGEEHERRERNNQTHGNVLILSKP
jgi:hypothetical protein